VFTDKEINYSASTGEYSIDENGDNLLDYSFRNPDFKFLQFRSNLVFRWEYIPGSVLYLVWSQERTGSYPAGDFSFGNNMSDLFKIHPHNVFLVKFTLRFNL
jgi:hypothetical protein